MKSRSELRDIIIKVLYQANLFDEAKINYDVDTLKQLAGFICSKLKDGIVFITNKKEDSMNFICKSS